MGLSKVFSQRGENPKVIGRQTTTRRLNLYLQHYSRTTGKKRTESLKLYVWATPYSKEEREYNRKTLELAKQIRDERDNHGRKIILRKDTNVAKLIARARENTADLHPNYKQAINVLDNFLFGVLSLDPESLFVDDLGPELITDFEERVKAKYKPETQGAYFSIIKRIGAKWVKLGYCRKSPFEELRAERKKATKGKDYLTTEEIQKLVCAEGLTKRQEDVRRAFLFSCLTGLRHCDCYNLTYGNVDYKKKTIELTQQKTGDYLSLPISDTVLQLIGESKGKKERVFEISPRSSVDDVPLANMIEKVFEGTPTAEKHITFHCGRVSFASNLASSGVDIKTLQTLTGHKSLSMVEVYLKPNEERRRAAAELNDLHISLSSVSNSKQGQEEIYLDC